MIKKTLEIIGLIVVVVFCTFCALASSEDGDMVLARAMQKFHKSWQPADGVTNIVGKSNIVVLKNVVISGNKKIYTISDPDDLMIIIKIPDSTTAYNINAVVHGDLCN